VRRSYRFVVVGYVVMPEHVHLLLSEPERVNPGTERASRPLPHESGFTRKTASVENLVKG
jgi:REP element-mobilizing transposase RayT